MSNPLKHLSRLALVASVLLGFGCSSTTLVNVWTTPERPSVQAQKVLVVTLAKRSAVRRSFEDAFVAELKEQKLDAAASYTLQPGEELPNVEKLADGMKEKGFQAMLVISLVAVDKQLRTVEPTAVPYRTMRGYYGFAYQSPGYITQDKVVVLEVRCYEAASEGLLWSATSKSVNPDSASEVAKELAVKTVRALREQKIVR